MARLYADENFNFAVVKELRSRGHDVLTVQEAHRQSEPDEVVLSDATAAGRVVLTHDRFHFVKLHTKSLEHSGILVCTNDPDPAELAKRIEAGLSATVDMSNRLLRINRPSTP